MGENPCFHHLDEFSQFKGLKGSENTLKIIALPPIRNT